MGTAFARAPVLLCLAAAGFTGFRAWRVTLAARRWG
jgi:hypothetical protein